jgi:hypothetical protein
MQQYITTLTTKGLTIKHKKQNVTQSYAEESQSYAEVKLILSIFCETLRENKTTF